MHVNIALKKVSTLMLSGLCLLMVQQTVLAESEPVMLTQSSTSSNGMTSLKSHFSVEQTADQLVAALNAKGMTVFARINHAEGASRIKAALAPMEVVIFGNPKVGTPLINCNPLMGIDLPQKALIWQDKNKQVWFSYNAPTYLQQRHHLGRCGAQTIRKIEKVLPAFARKATGQ